MLTTFDREIQKLVNAANTQHGNMLERVAEDLAKGNGIWDGKPATKVAAAHKIGPRMRLDNHPPDDNGGMSTDVFLDTHKVCTVKTVISLENGRADTTVEMR